MQKKKCYLCGGNLVNGVCVDCGLDNTRNDRKSYRLNCTTAEFAKDRKKVKDADSTLMKERQESYQQTAPQKTKQKSKYRMEQKPEQKVVQRRDANKRVRRNAKATVEGKKRSASKIVKIIIIAVIILNILPFIIEEGTEVIHRLTVYHTRTKQLQEQQEQLQLEEEQPYHKSAQYELSDQGEQFEIELTQGIYKIGAHIPEGIYSIERIEGSGFCKMVDYANGIYTHWWFSEFKESEKEGAVQFVEDAHLYQDGYLKIEGDVKIRFTSTCAQMEKMNSTVENPLSEKVYLNEGEEYIAGEDFPAGIYDLTTEAEWIGVKLNYSDIPDGYWVSSGNKNEGVFRNIYVPEGTTVNVENGTAIFIPSTQIESGSYDSYYINGGL